MQRLFAKWDSLSSTSHFIIFSLFYIYISLIPSNFPKLPSQYRQIWNIKREKIEKKGRRERYFVSCSLPRNQVSLIPGSSRRKRHVYHPTRRIPSGENKQPSEYRSINASFYQHAEPSYGSYPLVWRTESMESRGYRMGQTSTFRSKIIVSTSVISRTNPADGRAVLHIFRACISLASVCSCFPPSKDRPCKMWCTNEKIIASREIWEIIGRITDDWGT